ncbi:uncharacterized protein KY384_001060 [Bacidia gigantensis]|uniref:uncharacterized protein n=1 Tax=Bacidia gigantensis TaxID=2732470 RepID=UPI001D050284|nr:uncharacterized protein KY384_001060 [Bacidia gigantensis]KAG8534216.1 hypothetical protein KY384_001060 [Bacidia gigantensis]
MSIDLPRIDREILKRWTEIDAFQRQLELSKGRPPYTFCDGPPFATGLPHYGHLLASTIKDIIPRYWSMKGHYVERRFGWDTHGVPIEHEIDKKHGKSGRDLVQELGIEAYNKECRSIVLKYAEEWRHTIGRLGRWIDFDKDYKTMDPTFMETIWWVFKRLYDKGQVYRDYKVMPYSTALATPMSNFEENQNPKEVQDPAIVVAFPLRADPGTNLLIWTTTPWTVPSNIAIAVHPDFEYIKIRDEGTNRNYIIMETLLSTLYKDPKKAKFTKLETLKGTDFAGLEYEPPYKYFYEQNKDWWFRVYTADYVKSDSGTGLVHQSPSYGSEDYTYATQAGLINRNRLPPNPVDEKGCFTSEVSDYAGEYVRGPVEKVITKHLTSIGRLVVNSQTTHTVKYCWRSDTPLIQKAVSAWFVGVEQIVPEMLENIAKSHWVPTFVKEKRFANWIENAHDWNISRNRFWGTPLPIWTNEAYDEIVVIGSVAELKERSGYKGEITDLHRDSIDKITIPGKNGGILKRVEEVFDCWFESGSMPYAQVHYPFSFKDPSTFADQFPCNFISEGLDQTRGWFYTLVVLGTHLFGVSPFNNCVVSGIVLAENGKKMSKRLKNYPDPMGVIDAYGADALRLYMISSPVVRGETLRFSEAGVKDVISKVMLPLWNSYQFLRGQISLLKKTENVDFRFDPKLDVTKHGSVMDEWVQARCHSLLKFVDQEMAAYRLYTVVPELLDLIESLTNWYIRLNRRRLKGESGLESTVTGLNTLFEVLFILVRALAPFTPFIADHLYLLLAPCLPEAMLQGYQDTQSVHFLPYPSFIPERLDPVVERKVGRMQNIVNLARTSRERRTISLKTPLKRLVVIHADAEYLADLRELDYYIRDEVNVHNLELTSDESTFQVQYTCSADWPTLGKKLKKDAQKVRKLLPDLTTEQVKHFAEQGTIVVGGIKLTAEDLIVKREVSNSEGRDITTNTDDDVLTILDLERDSDLMQDGLAREIINRIQRLRKKAGLVVTDDVEMCYRVMNEPADVELSRTFKSRTDMIKGVVRGPLIELDNSTSEDDRSRLIVEEDQEIQKATFLLKLMRLKNDVTGLHTEQ